MPIFKSYVILNHSIRLLLVLSGDDNTAFYNAFARGWKKATHVGHNEDDLFPLSETC